MERPTRKVQKQKRRLLKLSNTSFEFGFFLPKTGSEPHMHTGRRREPRLPEQRRDEQVGIPLATATGSTALVLPRTGCAQSHPGISVV